jgi:hypothetical protein
MVHAVVPCSGIYACIASDRTISTVNKAPRATEKSRTSENIIIYVLQRRSIADIVRLQTWQVRRRQAEACSVRSFAKSKEVEVHQASAQVSLPFPSSRQRSRVQARLMLVSQCSGTDASSQTTHSPSFKRTRRTILAAIRRNNGSSSWATESLNHTSIPRMR